MDPACLDEGELPRGTQSETSIAIDSTGQHIVVGFNDFRGFDLEQTSVSGFMYSDDGGETFVDGGQLPHGRPSDQFGFPQVFGDPDVKYLGGCNFVYSSIFLVVKFFPGGPALVQTMSVHRSRDCGHTWEGPFEVTSASNPAGLLDPDGFPVDAADKEFIDVDRHTGRLLMTWTNFTDTSVAPGGTQILSTYSDDILSATPPTFSPRTVIGATTREERAPCRASPEKGTNAYVAWRRLPGRGDATPSRSPARRTTARPGARRWSYLPPFFIIDQILGNDRVHNFPSMAVDKSSGRLAATSTSSTRTTTRRTARTSMLLAQQQRRLSFSAPVAINSRPGNDRAQWFPAVTVDNDTGRVFVHYYDQGIAERRPHQGHVHLLRRRREHWSPPLALTDRPFHAGWATTPASPTSATTTRRWRSTASTTRSSPRRPGLRRASWTVDPDLSFTVPDVIVKVLPRQTIRSGPLSSTGKASRSSTADGTGTSIPVSWSSSRSNAQLRDQSGQQGTGQGRLRSPRGRASPAST